MEGYKICRDPSHSGAVWSHRLLAYVCPRGHEDGQTYYARQYAR